MEYEDICFASKKEAENREITLISSTFYEDIRAYQKELEDEIKKCNPSSTENLMLTDELNTALDRIEEIFFRRRNKIFSMAAQSTSEVEARHRNYDKLLPAEKKLYDYLLRAGEEFKKDVLNPKIDQHIELEPERGQEQKHINNGVQAYSDMLTVRILKDISAFMGLDGNIYTVKAEDIVSIPSQNAQLLIKKNVAQIVNCN